MLVWYLSLAPSLACTEYVTSWTEQQHPHAPQTHAHILFISMHISSCMCMRMAPAAPPGKRSCCLRAGKGATPPIL